jgi:medium-chain acyl-[acyl-carrier-protein] hydrolase
MIMIIFERKYPVNVFNADLTGKLSAGSLFSFLEDIAARHATILGWGRDNLLSGGHFWALSRMLVRIARLPAAMDEITLRTWPRGTDSIYALRDFELFDKQGNVLAVATSSWIVVDYNTRKVQRPDKTLSLNIGFPERKAVNTNAGKVPSLKQKDLTSTTMKAKLEDIDVNMHVNNARYIYWVMNSYDPEFINAHTPETLEVNYTSEGHWDDMIRIITAKIDETSISFVHSVVRETDNSELCRLRISWKQDQV